MRGARAQALESVFAAGLTGSVEYIDAGYHVVDWIEFA
jgi:enoyl-[acyl-carrier-protein] reductase (NADH)